MKPLSRDYFVAVALIGILGSCKSTGHRSSQAKTKGDSHIPNADTGHASNIGYAIDTGLATDTTLPEPAMEAETILAVLPQPPTGAVAAVEPSQPNGPVNFDKICTALKGKSFQQQSIAHQVRWLCDLGGFAALNASSTAVMGAGSIREYFEEYNQTMYYAAGISAAGSLDKASNIGSAFCNTFKGVRNSTHGKCEYLQEAKYDWGSRFDLLATKNYGKFGVLDAGRNIYWQVDTMVAPLNYSSLKQFSSLVLFWESEGRIKGVVLTRSRSNVAGAVLGATRTKLKSVLAKMVEEYANIVK